METYCFARSLPYGEIRTGIWFDWMCDDRCESARVFLCVRARVPVCVWEYVCVRFTCYWLDCMRVELLYISFFGGKIAFEKGNSNGSGVIGKIRRLWLLLLLLWFLSTEFMSALESFAFCQRHSSMQYFQDSPESSGGGGSSEVHKISPSKAFHQTHHETVPNRKWHNRKVSKSNSSQFDSRRKR